MVMIGFTVPNACENILSGNKTTTIRPYNIQRFEQIKRIGKLQLYWKPRTKECKLIAEVGLRNIDMIQLVPATWNNRYGLVYNLSFKQQMYNLEGIAYADGFESYAEMHDWFYNQYGQKMYSMQFMRIEWYPPKVKA